jgi:pimeloyl-ACP methyl ester carboxylesterase
MVSDRHVILLHAFPLNATMWRPQAEAAHDGWRFITPDFPGFGDSTEAPVSSMEAMAEHVIHIMDRLGVPRAVIGGLSMGGYVALALYRMAPDRFEGMILADTRASADDDRQKEGRRKMIGTVRARGAAAVADEMLPKLLSPASHSERPELTAAVRGMIEGTSAETIASALEAMMNRGDSTPLLSSIAVPALVLCGEADVLTPPPDAHVLAQGIRQSRLELLPRAGHLSNLEMPERFSHAVGEFLLTLP